MERLIKIGDKVKLKYKQSLKHLDWYRNVTRNKIYTVTGLYGSNVIFKDDTGNNVNGHGINRMRVTVIERSDK